VVSLLVTTLVAPLIGLNFEIGLLVAAAAMAGDLLSSFLKRRFGLASSSKATGLDQIPEALFPLLACRSSLSLTAIDIVVGSVIFFVGEILLSYLFFRLRLRDRPY
jgi:CDP-2,3-bis-(O-geranylgeranyl)-sn-glycerol synthase